MSLRTVKLSAAIGLVMTKWGELGFTPYAK